MPRTAPKSTRVRSLTGSVSKNAMFSPGLLDQGLPGRQVDGPLPRFARRLHRAGLHAQRASGAILHVHLERVPGVGQATGVQRHGREPIRGPGQLRLVVELGPDHAVRADEAAVAALDAQVRVPLGDQVGDVALLERGGAAGVGAVHRQRADRQVVAAPGHHLGGDPVDELRRARRHQRGQPTVGGHPAPGSATWCSAARAWSTAALFRATTSGAAAAVGLGDGRLDRRDRLLPGQHPGDGEEAGLQHRVDPPGQARLPGHLGWRRSRRAAISLARICSCTGRGRLSHTSLGRARACSAAAWRRAQPGPARPHARAARPGGSRRSWRHARDRGRGSARVRSAGGKRSAEPDFLES